MVDTNNTKHLIKAHISEHGDDLSSWPVRAQDSVLQSLLDQEKVLCPSPSDLLHARILKVTHPNLSSTPTPHPFVPSQKTWQAIAATLVVSMATGMGLGQFLTPTSTVETEYILADAYTDGFELILEVE